MIAIANIDTNNNIGNKYILNNNQWMKLIIFNRYNAFNQYN